MAFPVYQAVSTAERTGSGSQLDVVVTCAKPAGTVTGETLVAVCGSRSEGVVITPGLPPGWNLVLSVNNTPADQFIARRLVDATDPASYDFTFGGSTRTNSVAISRVSNANPTDPIDIFNTSTGVLDPAVAPSVNTTVNETLVLRALTFYRTTSVLQEAKGIERWEFLADGGDGGATQRHVSAGQTEEFATASATGTFTWFGNDFNWVASTLAIKPPSGPQPVFKPQFAHPFTK